jgi:subfamily B ATP-binding cassette protein MsbA
MFSFILGFGSYQVTLGQATIGSFMAFFTATLMAYQPMRRVLNTNTLLQRGLASAERVFEIIDHRITIINRPEAKPIRIEGGAVRFDTANFSYNNEITALHDVTLEAPAGRMTALVGPSGGGKSTILNLIPRFYDLDKGSVTIDGQDVRAVTLESLRASIAFVSQDTGLFDDTVRANIAYGRPDASEGEIVAAAEAASADGFIRELAQGYDTPVGERGVILSGGQRQRLSIARAVLKNAPILLLDEATSALDTESERHVQAALRRLMEGRTTIVIAHRLSTVVDADLIHVIDAGRVVESGTHATLSAAGGLYARLSRLQFRDEPTAKSA